MAQNDAPGSLLHMLSQLRERQVPQKQVPLYVNRYLEHRARQNLIPLSGTFELTPLCNLDCGMCYVHLTAAQFSPSKLLPVDTWKNLMLQAKRAGMLRATLTGGECLTYPGFDELYVFLAENGVQPGVLTNGALMTAERIALMKRYPPRVIQVTLYGSSEDDYEHVTGHRVFELVRGNLRAMRQAGLPVRVAVTPSQLVRGDIRNILETVRALELPYVINSNLFQPRADTGRGRLDLTDEEYIAIVRLRRELEHASPYWEEMDLSELPQENRTAGPEERRGLPCGAGRSAFVIQYHGGMCPCVGLDEISARPLETGFEAAWRTLNEKVLSYVMPGECGACAYRTVCPVCPIPHKGAPKGHCDPAVCERTRKYVAAGVLPRPGCGTDS